MQKTTRREFLKKAVIAGVSLYVPNYLVKELDRAEGHELLEPENYKIHILLKDRPELMLSSSRGIIRKYPVVAGMEKHKTPKGEFKILKKIYKPDWYPDPEKKWVQDVTEVVEYIEKNGTNRIPNDHYLNPLGLWKLTFRKFYHIHGDGDGALGRGKRYVSKGCVRMRNSDINHLANFVDVETPVYIT